MTDLQRSVLALIRSALTGAPQSLPDSFSMAEVCPIIRKHQIMTLAYEGAALCGVSPALPEMQQLFKLYCQCLLKSEQQLRAIASIYSAFDANKIDYLPLKGCNLKHLYPKPELRLMGDADILIRTEQYDEIRPIMEKLGFTAQTESDHEFIWNSPGLFLELHKRLMPSYNKDYHRYFGDGWNLAKPLENSRYHMSNEDEFVYIFCHFAKHYRSGGIGLRHVTDLWVYLQAHPNMDVSYLTEELKKLQLLDFYRNMRKLLSVWFEDAKSDDKTDFLTEYIFASGVWGSMTSMYISHALQDSKKTGSTYRAKCHRFLRMVFLPYVHMCKHYPVLKKCPVLLPLFWPVRWITAILFRRKNIAAQQQELKVSNKENVASFEASLNYVGLNFNFEE